MTWFRVDDSKSDHPKFLKATRDAVALWDAAGPMCARVDSDGLVDGDLVTHYGLLGKVPAGDVAAAVKSLVKVGLWHDSKTIRSCDRCMEATDGEGIKRGWFMFHDWWDYQPSKAGKRDPIERKRDRRKRALHRTEKGMDIKGRVRERDRDMCRYCGVLTHWTNDHTSETAGAIDHVNPLDFTSDGTGNSMGNCVVACRKCNGRKRDRTPEQAGMPLLPEPGEPVQSRYVSAQSQNASAPQPVRPSRDARDGPGSGRPGSCSGSGLDARSTQGGAVASPSR